MLRDVIERVVTISESLGVAAMVIHCRDDAAREFYVRHIDAVESPVDPLHLILPIPDARRVVEATGR